MPDNVTLPGTGAVVATDDVGGVQFQIVKIAYGADGTATMMDFMPASQATLAAMLAAFKPEDSPHVNGDLGIPMLGMRFDSDLATAGNDGDYTLFKMDETGRLKVSTQPATYLDVVGVISANGQSVFANVDRASNITITMAASALTGHSCIFEFSNNSTNGTDGNWYKFQAVRTDSNSIETNPGVLTSTPVYGWEASVNAYKWVRVRATAHTGGTATYTIKQGTYATEPIPAAQASATQTVTVTGTVGVTGLANHSAGISGAPVRVAGQVNEGIDTSLVNNDTCNLMLSNSGALIVKPFAVPETDWQYTGVLTTAAAVAAKGAGAAGIRNYVTDVSYQNTSATATTVLLQDGTTTIAQWHAPANMAQPAVVQFNTPRRGTAATAMNVNCGTAAANVLINVGGYQAK